MAMTKLERLMVRKTRTLMKQYGLYFTPPKEKDGVPVLWVKKRGRKARRVRRAYGKECSRPLYIHDDLVIKMDVYHRSFERTENHNWSFGTDYTWAGNYQSKVEVKNLRRIKRQHKKHFPTLLGAEIRRNQHNFIIVRKEKIKTPPYLPYYMEEKIRDVLEQYSDYIGDVGVGHGHNCGIVNREPFVWDVGFASTR